MTPRLGPVWNGGRSILDHSLTHETSGLGWPAFDDAFVQGRDIIAPEDLVVIPNPRTGSPWSSSNPGLAFYARGSSGLIYWFAHLDRRHAPGTRFRRGQFMAQVAPNHIGGGPHVHVAIDARPVLGRHLSGRRWYQLGGTAIGKQLSSVLHKDGYWQWLAWDLGEGAYKGYRREPKLRPDVPARVPASWWARRLAYLARRVNK